jgi:hypothetical protein
LGKGVQDNFSAFHLDPGPLEPLNPFGITNSFGGDPYITIQMIYRLVGKKYSSFLLAIIMRKLSFFKIKMEFHN